MYWMLQYDIPTASGLANPSRRLRRRAIRTNKSVWVCRGDRIPHALIASLIEGGATVHLWEWSASMTDQITRECRGALERAIQHVHGATRGKLERAGTKLDRTGNRKAYEDRVRAISLQASRELEDYRQAGEAFEMRQDTSGLQGIVNMLAQAAYLRCSAYVQLAGAVQGTALAVAAADDQIPLPILADFVEEQTGVEMSVLQGAGL